MNKPECQFDCIFAKGKDGNYHLHGDCRIPWSDKCYLNIKDKTGIKSDNPSSNGRTLDKKNE